MKSLLNERLDAVRAAVGLPVATLVGSFLGSPLPKTPTGLTHEAKNGNSFICS